MENSQERPELTTTIRPLTNWKKVKRPSKIAIGRAFFKRDQREKKRGKIQNKYPIDSTINKRLLQPSQSLKNGTNNKGLVEPNGHQVQVEVTKSSRPEVPSIFCIIVCFLTL